MSDSTDYRIEEYKQVRAELMERERVIGQLTIVSIVAIATLMSALAGAFFGGQLTSTQLGVYTPYILLAPILIVIPVFFIIGSHRRDLFRAGAYLQVFYEDENAGAAWQNRIQQFRANKSGDSLDTLPYFFWIVAGICEFLLLIGRDNLSTVNGLDVLILIILIGIMYHAHKLYISAPKAHRTECIQTWEAVKKIGAVQTKEEGK